MATIGQVLTTPEAGWTRYNSENVNISYTSGWKAGSNYHQISTMTAGKTEYASFNFVGSKIRFISSMWPSYVEKCYISIDGIEYDYRTNGGPVSQALVFEMTGLAFKEHSVRIYEKDVCATDLGLVFLGIDIDENGQLKPYPSAVDGSRQTLLRVTVIDSSEREYQLSTAEIDGFINWFNHYTVADTKSYMLSKTFGKEYLAFDKIISFEVISVTK